MARLDGEISNSQDADLFEILEDWNAYLRAENVQFPQLPVQQPKTAPRPRKRRSGPSL